MGSAVQLQKVRTHKQKLLIEAVMLQNNVYQQLG